MPSHNFSTSLISGALHETSLTKAKVNRNHPPRLQHSPSLPNIWFPPHSGPIPPEFEGIEREPLQRPSTPPLTVLPHPEDSSSLSNASDDQALLPSDDPAQNLYQAQPLKIHRRCKTDRDQSQSHSLLTPPLTPSSSLKTVASVESSVPTEREPDAGRGVNKSTRFLLLGNISRQLGHEALRSSIVGSLTFHPESSQSVPVLEPLSKTSRLTEDCIKGFFFRRQQTDGVVILAFFDVRHAEIAKQIISDPSNNLPLQCVGDELAENSGRAWITCRFVSAEELEEITGKSTFLASMNASFYLRVENKNVADGVQEITSKVTEDPDTTVLDDSGLEAIVATKSAGELVTDKLESFLNSFGALRSFTPANDMLAKTSSIKIFHLEYCDVRDADLAYPTLDGQGFFGMKLSVFGREGFPDTVSSLSPRNHKMVLTPANVPTPHSTNATVHSVAFGTNIGTPGQYSNTRDRYQHIEGNQPHLPIFTSNRNALVDSNCESTAPSPTYFYTSNAVEHPDFLNSAYCQPEQNNPEEFSYINSYNYPIESGPDWTADHNRTPRFYHRDCYYCPSSANTSTTFYEYHGSCPTASPYCYQPSQALQPPQATPFLHLPVQAYTHEFNNTYLRPMHLTTAPGMIFEHTVPPTLAPLAGENISVDAAGTQPNTPSMRFRTPINSIGGTATSYTTPKFRASSSVPSNGSYSNVRPPLSSNAIRGTRVHSQAVSRDSRSPAEHNQLNISRIEDGQDTRTTVMIKNIPNKMSDKDLIAYIGKVCPRKIDFLYLRMDFTNGCNVGYAFVNFIAVQDLLTFAKEKLGEKWNMFSSEKVLQMSYATYQGKEALVEKFKNSCIMDVQEAWRPKIFYSEPGPEQGLPELFPAPTHIRRKERNALNRGALFVPGVPTQHGSSASRRLEETHRRGERVHPEPVAPNFVYPSIGTSYNRRVSKNN